LDSTLKDHSILFQWWKVQDILLQMEETYSLKIKPVKTTKHGGLTRDPELLSQSNLISHLTSKGLEDQATYKSGTQTMDGGNNSSIMVQISLTSRTTKFLILLEEEIEMGKMWLFGKDTTVLIKDGELSILILSRIKV